jgi:hypothetical protein
MLRPLPQHRVVARSLAGGGLLNGQDWRAPDPPRLAVVVPTDILFAVPDDTAG